MRKRILRKSIAIFLLLVTVGNVVAPTVSYALTSGPTAPEATSFEPVDTTDMVNLITGDLTYNMPLLEVPGPSGSYPLSLSYHAGIQPNEDASWVGLGWTLNPGAITRLTNGLPDDFDGTGTTSRSYWEGGETTQTSVGVSIGIANVATVSAGLTFSQDTYRGFGVGGYLGASIDLGKNSPLSLNASVGISPYGGVYSSLGIGLSYGKTANNIQTSASTGLSVNSSGSVNASLSGGVGLASDKRGGKDEKGNWKNANNQSFSGSLLGASINSSGGGGVLSAGGFTSEANNSREGTISSTADSWSVDIPVWFGVNISLGRSHIRYWMDETVSLKNYGTLNFPSNELQGNDKNVYDSYHVQGVESIASKENPEKYLEGSFADYDQYSVSAQGLAGNIRPHHYLLSLYSQDIINESSGNKSILNYNIPQHAVGTQFRFVNDFSNKLTNNPADIEVNKQYIQTEWTDTNTTQDVKDWKARILDEYDDGNSSGGQTTTTTIIPLFFPYSSPETGLPGDSHKRFVPNVPGSKHIEYFTNEQILNYKTSLGTATQAQKADPKFGLRAKRFIECNAKGYSRSNEVNDKKVGAFTITNSSGVNYHFSLPAYAYDEHTYSGSKDDQGKLSYSVVSQYGRYAYTWYLTGMTGPDYVDRGPEGKPDDVLNEYDWGYWVDFQYGKWTEDYQWRNPSDGFNQDVDHRIQTFSMGKKEVYYLNKIKTKSHSALFVKEIRPDAKGLDPTNIPVDGTNVYSGGKFTNYPRASLKLKEILITRNDPYYDELENASTKYDHRYTYEVVDLWGYGGVPLFTHQEVKIIHYGENVIDVFDIVNRSVSPIRKIELESDYSLAPNTFNSFDPFGDIYPPAPLTTTISAASQKLGKLTLNAIKFRGKDGLDFLPATKFSYDITSKENLTGMVTVNNSLDKSGYLNVNGFPNVFSVGDLVTFNQNGKSYFGYIDSPVTSTIPLKFISELPINGLISSLSKTKNPPYNKDMFDVWGMYKCDFKEIVGAHLNNYPSELSVKNSDVWSLRTIENSTGSRTRIEYESDTFGENVLENLTAKLEPSTTIGYCGDQYNSNTNSYPVPITFKVVAPSNITFDFLKRYAIGEQINIAADIRMKINNPNVAPSYYLTHAYSAIIVSVSKDELILSSCIPVFNSGGIIEEATFERGKVSLKSSRLSYGGGIRVKKLSIFGSINNELSSTQYQYDFDNRSSGVTSYEPVSQYIDNKMVASFNQEIIINTLALARDVPSPGVFYKKVRVSETNSNLSQSEISIPGYSEYIFEVFNKEMIKYDKSTINASPTTGIHKTQTYQNINTRRVVLRDFTQRIGKLKSVTLFDKDGRKMNETINHYLHDEQVDQSFASNSSQYPTLLDRFNKQGVIHETFNHARLVKNTTGSGYTLQGLISKKENYPAIQTGTTSINYKTGIKTESKTLAFDFYNGNVSKSLEIDGYGNSFVTDISYAYSFYPTMGLKSEYFTNTNSGHPATINNAHMIDQQAGSTTYRVVSSTDLSPVSIVSASAQTWSDEIPVMGVAGNNQTSLQSGIWRKKSSFSYIGDQYAQLATTGDGLVAATSFQPFTNWTSDAVQSGWQRNATITKYDYNSHAIEARDMNDKYAATKFSYDHSQVLATAANANYDELAYSGAEETLQQDQAYHSTNFPYKAVGGGLYVSDEATIPLVYPIIAHTGYRSVQSPAGKRSFQYSFTAENKKYQVSVWTSQTDAKIKYKLNQGATQEAVMELPKKSGDWYLLTGTIQASAATPLEIWCEAGAATTLFDDFRLHPVQAAMTSYVYNNWGELTHILDNNNLYTKYEYDGMGRLTKTYRERLQPTAETPSVSKISEVAYHYALSSPAFMVPIQTSVAAGNGSISQNVNVLQGGTAIINATNSCENLNYQSKIYADGKLLSNYYGPPTGAPVTLYDGAKAYLENGVCKLVGVQGNHKIKVEFALPSEVPLDDYATCEYTPEPNSCPTGRYFLFTHDACDREVKSLFTYSFNELPLAVRNRTLPCPTPDPNTNCTQFQQ